jgi:hypothetical protein
MAESDRPAAQAIKIGYFGMMPCFVPIFEKFFNLTGRPGNGPAGFLS